MSVVGIPRPTGLRFTRLHIRLRPGVGSLACAAMQTAETSTLPRTLVVCVATAALSLGAGGAASASSDTTEPADSEPTHTTAGHTVVDTAGGDATGNTLHITERDYEFQVEGN